ncbi:L-lactate dehydrogenase complex protein LldG [Oryzomicrobium terrae]|uniref:L-lactate dehydrogenase complex protein LldG n=1 Tax=Oryzomicrobium terrae TaxID=1735038 RepID=A0A5C1EB34_9RHOO|nr:lactate utilization protein [Oryzomicrobium terrae]QEL65789.1 L-lactate dehydrogenase complex protein LldG [Oryzomicrobium terrae]
MSLSDPAARADIRASILGRLRDTLGADPAAVAARRASVEARLGLAVPATAPALADDPEALLSRFQGEAEQLASTVAVVEGWGSVPAAVAAYLAEKGLDTQGVIAPELAALPWAGAGLAVEPREARDADLLGITGCFCAIAETGTLMLLSAPGSPATVSLLPETHVALIPVSRLVPTMEAAFARLRETAPGGQPPRAVNFISGPSRTGDIEQTLVLGAHGPYRVHLILIRGA